MSVDHVNGTAERGPSQLEQIFSKLGPLFTHLAPFRFGLQAPVYELVWRGLAQMRQTLVVTMGDGSRANWMPVDAPPNFLFLGTIVYCLDNPTIIPRI